MEKVEFTSQQKIQAMVHEREKFISDRILEYIDQKYDEMYIYDKRLITGKTSISINLAVSPYKLVEDEDTKLTYALNVYEIDKAMKVLNVSTPLELFRKFAISPKKYTKFKQSIVLKKEGD